MTSLFFRFVRSNLCYRNLLWVICLRKPSLDHEHTSFDSSCHISALKSLHISVLEYLISYSLSSVWSIHSHEVNLTVQTSSSPSSSNCHPTTTSLSGFLRVLYEVVPHTERSLPYLLAAESLYMPLTLLFRKFSNNCFWFRINIPLHPLSICWITSPFGCQDYKTLCSSFHPLIYQLLVQTHATEVPPNLCHMSWMCSLQGV